MNGTGVAFKDFVGTPGGTTGVIGVINTIIVPIIFALAFLVFIWGVFQYFFVNQDSETKRDEGKQFIIWGVLGMVVLFSVWGIVNILLSTLGIVPTT